MAKEDRSGDLLATLKRDFENAEDTTADARLKAERDRDYYDNKQLTQEEYDALLARGQPPISENVIRRKIDYLAGLEKQTRQDPKAYPRNPSDEGAADAATDSIRYVCDGEEAPYRFSECFYERLIEGIGAIDVCIDRLGEGDADIRLNRIPWDRFYYDPHSRLPDFSDARYLGIVLWMDEEEVLARWPDADDLIEGSYRTATQSDTYDDRPRSGVWGDINRRRVRVCQAYFLDGMRWKYATFTAGGFLDEPADSPYLDDKGEPACAIIAQSAYVDRDNNRYGVVRDMVDLQDEINKRRSKALHLLNVRQAIAEQGAVQDVDVARRELARPDGYIEIAPGMRFEIQQTTDLAQGQFQLLQEAKQAFDLMGPNAAMQGKQGQGASGRAIALSQQGGAIEAGGLLDSHRYWKRRIYSAIWCRIRQFWTAEKMIRVTEEEGNVRFIAINRPVTLAEELTQMDPAQAQMIAQKMGLMQGDPRLDEPVRVENNVAELEVDIIVDEAPDVVTLQQENFQALVELAKAAPQAIPFDLIIEASSLRRSVKDKILERMKAQQEAAAGGGPDPGAMAAQAKMATAQADIQIKQQKAVADVQISAQKARGDMAVQAYKARGEMELRRQSAALDAMATAMQPAAPVPALASPA